jgi:hypothetical protein
MKGLNKTSEVIIIKGKMNKCHKRKNLNYSRVSIKVQDTSYKCGKLFAKELVKITLIW